MNCCTSCKKENPEVPSLADLLWKASHLKWLKLYADYLRPGSKPFILRPESSLWPAINYSIMQKSIFGFLSSFGNSSVVHEMPHNAQHIITKSQQTVWHFVQNSQSFPQMHCREWSTILGAIRTQHTTSLHFYPQASEVWRPRQKACWTVFTHKQSSLWTLLCY